MQFCGPHREWRKRLTWCAFACLVSIPPAAVAAASADLMATITSLIGDAACDQSAQCRIVPIGAKPCGGPSGYLAWSHKTTDEASLLAAVRAHAAAQKQEDQAGGLASDCSVVPVPSAACRPRAGDGKTTCQLGPGGAGRLD